AALGGKSPAAARRFHKPQTSFEVLNDVNSNLTNLYRCVREQPKERRTAAGEMLPFALRASGNQCFVSQFYARF
ncbi:MAG: hypothetical protein IJ265_07365, partial [Oscillospiraceae bacterium]|nr:hypothetical protein [Oscillospiraceae bacterium]